MLLLNMENQKMLSLITIFKDGNILLKKYLLLKMIE